MKIKLLLVLTVVSLWAFTLTLKATESPSSVPPGLDPKKWVAITGDFGFYVNELHTTKAPTLTEEARKGFLKTGQFGKLFNSVSGFYLIRVEGEWLRFEPPGSTMKVVPVK